MEKKRKKRRKGTNRGSAGRPAARRGRSQGRLVGARHASPSAGKRKWPRVPPPESDVWPEEYRGENWKPAYAFLFEGKCQLCAHSCPLPKSRQLMDKYQGNTRLLHCTNHPAHPGGIVEVLPTDTCRNFRLKYWRRARTGPAQDAKRLPRSRPGHKVERIPLGNGLFAAVDAADREEISRHKWRAFRQGRKVYAMCTNRRRSVFMHRMLMRPRKGHVVDHKDGNGLNNCRDNLRECTRRQNCANRGPCGASRFVGVYRRRDKWRAVIRYRGKLLHIGTFNDEVQAAKARDRKAWELNGEFAYLNFPEDYTHKRRKPASARGTGSTRRRRPR